MRFVIATALAVTLAACGGGGKVTNAGGSALVPSIPAPTIPTPTGSATPTPAPTPFFTLTPSPSPMPTIATHSHRRKAPR